MKAQGYTKETILDLGIAKTSFPEFAAGDTIAVHRRIKEGDKERIQVFEGDVIAVHNRGGASSFTIRKMGAHGIPVELIIPFNSPIIKAIDVMKRGSVRRSKLYYIRDRVGKATRLKEKIMTREQKEQQAHDLEENQTPTPPTNGTQPPAEAV